MPLLWWVNILQDDVHTLKHWNTVNIEVSNIIPGLQLEHLHVSPSDIAKLQLHDTDMGHVYETLLAASLAVKFQLLKLQYPTQKLVLSDIIDVLPYSFYSTPIDWSEGVCFPAIEAKIGSSQLRAICVNTKIHKAHHDIIVSNEIALSCKYSMTWPKPDVIIAQMDGLQKEHRLLWCFLGADRTTKQFEHEKVRDYIMNGKLAFVSGSHVISDVTISLLKSLKLVYEEKRGRNQKT